MFKTFFLFLLLLFSVPKIFAQCLAPVSAPACNGTEPLVIDNETMNTGTTKWYYGSTTMMNSLTLNGGILVVCGDLTIDKFYMDKGTIIIRPGARFVIGSGIGAGLVLKGDSYIYNYGTFEVQRNLSLDNGATAATPNILINATAASVFKMSNQYFVINNAFSWFINNGSAEFWGIITDSQASPASVCLGNASSTRMAVLINKIADTYRVPVGTACLNVYQFSQFNNKLTTDPGLLTCLGSGHNSFSGCGGCPANNWGAAQVFAGCAGCSALTVLSAQFISFSAAPADNGATKLVWQIDPVVQNGFFRIERSANGKDYQIIDSFIVKDANSTSFNVIDKNPVTGNNYYMIRYTDPATGLPISSKPIKIFSGNTTGFSVYPIPFDTKFFIDHAKGTEKIILTDLTGKNIPIRYTIKPGSELIEVGILQKVQPGIYIIHIKTEKNVMARTVFKE